MTKNNAASNFSFRNVHISLAFVRIHLARVEYVAVICKVLRNLLLLDKIKRRCRYVDKVAAVVDPAERMLTIRKFLRNRREFPCSNSTAVY